MPDTAVHMSFGEEVRAALAPEIRQVLDLPAYRIALLGPDPWFVHHFWRPKNTNRGTRMHTTRTGEFLLALAIAAKDAPDAAGRNTLFSYLSGFLCHYSLDASAHPYIICRTAGPGARKGSHRAFEHTLDILELRRLGLWGSRHAVTETLMPRLRLPRSMQAGLDEAYRKVYGWQHCWKDLARLYPFFRFLYRLMENPHGILSFLARHSRSSALKSLAYPESWFAEEEAENRQHHPWTHSHDSSLICTDSFPDLRKKAAVRAEFMIQAAWDFLMHPDVHTPELLAEAFGNDSYYSGLAADDPRNHAVPSMAPAPEK